MKKNAIALLCSLLFMSFTRAQSNPETIWISNDIQLIQLSKNAWVHVSYSELPGFGRFASNGLVIVQQNKAFLFDTPITNELTKTMVQGISDSLNANVTGFIPNHWHEDCMGGLEYLHSIGIPSYANQMTIDIAKTKGLPSPQNGFTDSLTLWLDGLKIECFYPGAAHSMDNIVVWLPAEKILFAGCMVKELRSTSLGNTADGDVNAYAETISQVLEKFPQAQIVIPGHGLYGGTEIIKHTLRLAKEM